MASVIYPKAKEAFAQALVNWNTADVRAILIDLADYTYNAAHDFLDDVPVAARVAVSASLTNKTSVNGILDADDTTFTAVAGDVSEAVILYVHTGVDATSRLLIYIDTAAGLPATPAGVDIPVIWQATNPKIAEL